MKTYLILRKQASFLNLLYKLKVIPIYKLGDNPVDPTGPYIILEV